MNKNNLKRWGSIGLIAVMSTVFIFQNNSMIKKNAVISDLKTAQVVAYTDDDPNGSLQDYMGWSDEVLSWVIGIWDKIVAWIDDGQYWCKCYPNNGVSTCLKGHKYNYKRGTCHTASVSGPEPNCPDYDTACNGGN